MKFLSNTISYIDTMFAVSSQTFMSLGFNRFLTKRSPLSRFGYCSGGAGGENRNLGDLIVLL